MSSVYDSSYSSGWAAPEKIENFWDWFPEHIQMQLDRQHPSIANPFISDLPADPDSNESCESSLDELESYIHELLQDHRLNQEVPLLFDSASLLDANELLDSFFPDLESASGFNDPIDPFREPVTFDVCPLAMPTPIRPQQEVVGKWLQSIIPPSSTSSQPPLPSPEPTFDAAFSSFLLSPTFPDKEDASPSTTSEDPESDNPSTASSEYESDQSSHANCSEASASTCHFHNGVFHGDPHCACNCGAHCDFLRENSKRFESECDCPCHTCCPSRERTQTQTQTRLEHQPSRDSMDVHLETLDQAERGAVFTVPSPSGSETSYHTATEWQERVAYQAFFHFLWPTSQPRLQPHEVDEPFLVWSGEDANESILDL